MATVKKKMQAGGVSKKSPKAPMVDPNGAWTKVQERTLGNMKKGGKLKKQAAVAIAMKKAGKAPKKMMQYGGEAASMVPPMKKGGKMKKANLGNILKTISPVGGAIAGLFGKKKKQQSMQSPMGTSPMMKKGGKTKKK